MLLTGIGMMGYKLVSRDTTSSRIHVTTSIIIAVHVQKCEHF